MLQPGRGPSVDQPEHGGAYVSNIFDKTGAANRTEAASYAHRHGLV